MELFDHNYIIIKIIYYESGNWYRYEYDANNNFIYFEDSTGNQSLQSTK
jgi:hypothetical protein